MTQVISQRQLYQKAVQRLTLAGITNSINEVAWIFEHTVGLTRLRLHLFPDQTIASEDYVRTWECIERRALGEPLQYILGSQEFWGMNLTVSSSVLIPRTETELLVEATMASVQSIQAPVLVDVGTGSGCLALALSSEFPKATIFATDYSIKAVRVAKQNATEQGLVHRVNFWVGDLLTPLSSDYFTGKVTAIVANLPYIRESEWPTLSREVRDFEPKQALVGGPDGLALYRRLFQQAEPILAKGGNIILEVGEGQANLLSKETALSGIYRIGKVMKDSLGIERVVCLERRG